MITCAPSVFWKKFFSKFPEIETKNINEWEIVHVISYFCKLYKKQYNIDYTFKFNAAPTKSFEVHQIKKITSMLSSDPIILKQYIDWLFDKKVIERKKRITTISYLANVNMVNEFKFLYLATNKITRATVLPDNYKEICLTFNQEILTYGDLAFIKLISETQNNEEYKKILQQLEYVGLDLNMLNDLK